MVYSFRDFPDNNQVEELEKLSKDGNPNTVCELILKNTPNA